MEDNELYNSQYTGPQIDAAVTASHSHSNKAVLDGITSQKVSDWDDKGTYSKPSGGIPKTDLASAVQTSLGKADSALQEHQDISGKENISNKVTSISSSSDNMHYPTAKAVYSFIESLDGNGVAY